MTFCFGLGPVANVVSVKSGQLFEVLVRLCRIATVDRAFEAYGVSLFDART